MLGKLGQPSPNREGMLGRRRRPQDQIGDTKHWSAAMALIKQGEKVLPDQASGIE